MERVKPNIANSVSPVLQIISRAQILISLLLSTLQIRLAARRASLSSVGLQRESNEVRDVLGAADCDSPLHLKHPPHT